MSIMRAMWTGVSGLNAEGQALGVIGDNVANSNTVGYKASRAVFEDVLGSAIGQNLGNGVRMMRPQQIFAQGSIVNTGQATDLALTGDGFFVVSGSLDGQTGQFFTRAGQTAPDSEGFLTTPQGMRLQGYVANADGTFASGLSDIQIPQTPIPPKVTSEFTLDANLDANAVAPTAAWDPTNPSATSNFSTTTKVYDSLGNAHNVDVYFVKTGPNTWDYHTVANGAELDPPTPGNVEIGGGNLTFNSDGSLQDHVAATPVTASFMGATPNQAIDLDFGTSIAAGGTGTDGITQYGNKSSVGAQSQDGYAAGNLSGVKVDPDGTVMGLYSNGEELAVAKIAVAKFSSNDGLARAGHNMWAATRDSGEATIGTPGGGRATVVAGALEQSNVDLATQFVELIAHQRSFQANSKTITTADEMLQELVNLKR